MTRLENFQRMVANIDEFAKWLNENCGDDAAWILWYDKNYCKECACVNINGEESFDYDADYAYCEIYKKCRFFPDMNEVPDCLEIVKMWLNSEA